MKAERPGLKKQQELRDKIAQAQGYENHKDAVMQISTSKTVVAESRSVYFVNQATTDKDGNLIVCIAKEGEIGYYLTDWIWGKDYDFANMLCDEKNMAMGISPAEAMIIQLRTMREKSYY